MLSSLSIVSTCHNHLFCFKIYKCLALPLIRQIRILGDRNHSSVIFKKVLDVNLMSFLIKMTMHLFVQDSLGTLTFPLSSSPPPPPSTFFALRFSFSGTLCRLLPWPPMFLQILHTGGCTVLVESSSSHTPSQTIPY